MTRFWIRLFCALGFHRWNSASMNSPPYHFSKCDLCGKVT
jgi:hypothetical protein